MPRSPRRHQHGEYHHVINRANNRSTIFFDGDDYHAFVRLLAAGVDKYALGLLGYCVMPNHWHLLLRPQSHTDMSRALHWVTSLHAHKWSRQHAREGLGHVYQGRFKSVPVQDGINLWRVLRYVERNALAAGLVTRAEDWPWCSAHQRRIGGQVPTLMPQRFMPQTDWLEHINLPADDPEVGEAIRNNLPIGDPAWVARRHAEIGIKPKSRGGRPPRARRRLSKNEKPVPVT